VKYIIGMQQREDGARARARICVDGAHTFDAPLGGGRVTLAAPNGFTTSLPMD
jgi:hypothetical protein